MIECLSLFFSFSLREKEGRSFNGIMEMEEERNRGGRKQIKIGTTRRNARERNRVRHINTCFEILREHIPHEKHNKKLSKVDTLKSAMIYIENLRQLLQSSSYHQQTNFDIPIDIKQENDYYWKDQHDHC
jgi:hypothetical protein